jgi:superfamily II DNA or RNA helicase
MPNDSAASGDTASHALWNHLFGAPLVQAARTLIAAGGVSQHRVLQNGRVMTGIAHGQRVYVQIESTGTPSVAGECTCNDRSPCVHVAAVVMAAAPQGTDRPAPAIFPPRPGDTTTVQGPSTQHLRYLIEPGAAGSCQLTVWVTQVQGQAQSDTRAHLFAPRTADGTRDYPRYVDAQDRLILATLFAHQPDGPWHPVGGVGFALLQQAVRTGRAFWQFPDSTLPFSNGVALRAGAARRVPFAWMTLPNGDQQLQADSAPAVNLALQLDPIVYIDTTSGECGPLELPYPAELLRRHLHRTAVPPEDVAALNAELARAGQFPRLRAFDVQQRPLATLTGQLALTDLKVVLRFLYNGKPVDSTSLLPQHRIVRQLDGNTVHEITRDLDTEARLTAELHRVLPDTPRNGAAWLDFMMAGVPALQALGWQVVIDRHFPYRLAVADHWYADLQTPKAARAQRRAASASREWFDLRLGVKVDGQAVNLLPALVQYLQGTVGHDTAGQHDALSLRAGEHLLIRLEDGRYLPVAMARIQRIADTLVELYDHEGLSKQDSLTLPAAQAGRLAELTLDNPDSAAAPSLTLQADDPSLLTRIDAVHSFAAIVPLPAPEQFHATLRPYQQEGLGWLQFLRRTSLGGILADDMGLGKTVQTLAHLVIEKQAGRLRKPSLIVAPVSVLGNWQQEIRRFAPQLTLLTLHGAKRKAAFASIGSTDIVLIGYPLLLLDSEFLLAQEFCFVILDEAQTIKNPQAKVSQVARALRSDHRLCLTGTPMENHLGELWSLFDFAQPGLLGERQAFHRQYRTPIESNGDTKRAAALSRRILPFLLRRTKDAVARDLPPKIQIIEPIELDERQRDFYDGIRLGQHRRVQEAIQHLGLARSQITVLDALLKLRQVCCDPRLVKRALPDDPEIMPAPASAAPPTAAPDPPRGSALADPLLADPLLADPLAADPLLAPLPADARLPDVPSAKLDWLRTTLPALIAEGRRILLFSQFTSMLSLIEAVVQELAIPYCLLSGETQNRTERVDRFQRGEVPLFLISLKAGGTGLNLTAADTIIHYDPWWNPAVEAQATDRAHRIGQTKTVFVYKLIAQGTVEEKIMQLQADKHALVTQLYTDKNAGPATLSSEDLESLFAP